MVVAVIVATMERVVMETGTRKRMVVITLRVVPVLAVTP